MMGFRVSDYWILFCVEFISGAIRYDIEQRRLLELPVI